MANHNIDPRGQHWATPRDEKAAEERRKKGQFLGQILTQETGPQWEYRRLSERFGKSNG
jgi:hypothetical protein